MNIRTITVAAAVMCMLVLPVRVMAEPAKTELLPEVGALLNPAQPDAAALPQNAFVGLLALDAPEDADYMAVGWQMVLGNHIRLKQMLVTPNAFSERRFIDASTNYYQGKASLNLDMSTDERRRLYACMNLSSHGCAAEILNLKGNINALADRNAVLMGRYLEVTSMPHYQGYYIDALATYNAGQAENQVALSNMRLAQALMALNAGRVDQGLAAIESEMAFVRRKLANEQTVIGQVISGRQLATIYHVISEALDMPAVRLHLNDARWAELLRPLSLAEQQGLARALESERNLLIYHLYTSDGLEKADWLQQISRDMLSGSQGSLLSDIDMVYDKEATLNGYYVLFQSMIDRAEWPLQKVSDLHAQGKLVSFEQFVDAAIEKQLALMLQQHRQPNGIGEYFLQHVAPPLLNFLSVNIQDYSERLYDVQVYGVLLNAKYLMLQAGVQMGDRDAVNAFLQGLGPAGLNPYMQQPFIWDARNQLLSTPWINQQNSQLLGGGSPLMAVQIRQMR